MVLYGTIHRVGDSITAEQILAPGHRSAGDPAVLAAHCLAAVDSALAGRVQEGDILLAGRGFGAGEGAEHAVLALQAVGFVAVICTSVAERFEKTAHAAGLPVLVCPAAAAIAAGTIARLDLGRGMIEDRATGAVYHAAPAAPEVIAAVRHGQLLLRMRRVVEEEGFDG